MSQTSLFMKQLVFACLFALICFCCWMSFLKASVFFGLQMVGKTEQKDKRESAT